jgi:hypothetical protein
MDTNEILLRKKMVWGYVGRIIMSDTKFDVWVSKSKVNYESSEEAGGFHGICRVDTHNQSVAMKHKNWCREYEFYGKKKT